MLIQYLSPRGPAGCAPETPSKQMMSPDAPFGSGLRLSAREARELLGSGGERLRELRSFLDEAGLYVAVLGHQLEAAVSVWLWAELYAVQVCESEAEQEQHGRGRHE